MLTAQGELYKVDDWDFTDEQIEVWSLGTYPGALGFMHSKSDTAIAGPGGLVTHLHHHSIDDY